MAKEGKLEATKADKNLQKREEKVAKSNEKKKIENKIKELATEKKKASDKETKKNIQKEITKLKKDKKNIDKKDTYLGDVLKEMHMVRWPSTKEVVKYSIASLVFIIFFALFFYGIDVIFALVKDLIS